MQKETAYWFPAKQYGWGWGVPSVWQGWVVLAIFTILLTAGGAFLLPAYGPVIFTAYTVLVSAGLVAVCWLKGEPPAWRWGDK